MFAATDTAALFRSVYEAPRERARRQVLADALMEAGDPRGEFISLQLDGATRSKKRAQKLLDRHELQWLEPLRPALVRLKRFVDPNVPRHRLGLTEWRDGFLVAAQVELSGALSNEPAWATLEALELHNVLLLEPMELASPWMRSLERVRLAVDPARSPQFTWENYTATVDRVRTLLIKGRRPNVAVRN